MQFTIRSRKIVPYVFIVLLIAAASAVALLYTQRGQANPEKPTPPVAISPISFDAAAAPGWRKGPGNEASLAAFYNDADCFVSLFEKSEKYDELTWLSKLQEKFAADPSHIYAEGEVIPLKLQTVQGPLAYSLYPYTVQKSDGSQNDVYGEQAYGFIPFENGHLFFQAYCDPTEVELLPTALPALEAFRYSPVD